MRMFAIYEKKNIGSIQGYMVLKDIIKAEAYMTPCRLKYEVLGANNAEIWVTYH